MNTLQMNTFRIFSTLLIALSCVILSVPQLQAQDMKIGYVDPRVVLEKMLEMKAVQQRLQNFAERKQSELSAKEQELQQEFLAYQERSATGMMDEEAMAREEERLGQMDLELRQQQALAQQELDQQRVQLMSPLLEQIQGAINSVAEAKGLSYVLNTTTSAGDVIILYVSEEMEQEYNITDAVMMELGI